MLLVGDEGGLGARLGREVSAEDELVVDVLAELVDLCFEEENVVLEFFEHFFFEELDFHFALVFVELFVLALREHLLADELVDILFHFEAFLVELDLDVHVLVLLGVDQDFNLT